MIVHTILFKKIIDLMQVDRLDLVLEAPEAEKNKAVEEASEMVCEATVVEKADNPGKESLDFRHLRAT